MDQYKEGPDTPKVEYPNTPTSVLSRLEQLTSELIENTQQLGELLTSTDNAHISAFISAMEVDKKPETQISDESAKPPVTKMTTMTGSL